MDKTVLTKNFSQDILIMQMYVGDKIFGTTHIGLYDIFSKLIHGEFEMSMMGELHFFFGLQIK